MKTNTYLRFASLLQSGTCSSYSQICRFLHVAPDDLDELLLAELGTDGQTLFDSLAPGGQGPD